MTPDSKGIAGLHLVRYGTAAEQKFLLGPFLGTYDQVVFNASIVAHMPAALANFIATHARNKPYFIDPQTHAFQYDITHLLSSSEKREGRIKRSYQRLLNEYDDPIRTRVEGERSSVLPGDFDDATLRRRFCERVIRFQLEAIMRETEGTDSAKYYRYKAKKSKTTQKAFGPSIAVAPYFSMTAATLEKWLPVNISCARDSQEYCRESNTPLAVQVVISRDLLMAERLRERLLKAYKRTDTHPTFFLIWVDSFSESSASEGELIAFIDLLRRFGDLGAVVNLYGGFLSVALARCRIVETLSAVCHGPEYGEHRSLIPVGGGIPIAKFYLPALHTRLTFREALRAIRALGGLDSVEDYHRTICNCRECRNLVKRNPETDLGKYGATHTRPFFRDGQMFTKEYPTPVTKEHCVRHYMWSKYREYRDPHIADNIIQQLRHTEKALRRVLGLDGVSHCSAWARVLDKTNI